MARSKQIEQLEFDRVKLSEKRFTLQSMVSAKFDKLANRIDQLTHSDVIWLSRVEDFFHKNEYLTERQSQVLDSIFKRQTKMLS